MKLFEFLACSFDKIGSKKKGANQIFSDLSQDVTTAGFEPARPCEHQPLKLASLPFLHVALNKKSHSLVVNDFLVTWLGLEPRTPSLKVMCSTN
jgi:hypothetical protein